MFRKLSLFLIAGVLLAVLVGPQTVDVSAQGGADAWALYDLNMRTGPGPDYALVAVVVRDTPLVFEARNEDMSWLLGHTQDGAHRGWVSSLYLRFQTGFAAARLPVSGETVGEAAQPETPPDNSAPVAAPAGVGAYTVYALNVRSGPGPSQPLVGQVPGNTGIILEGRNADGSWVLGHTQDGSMRGWLSSLYLKFVGINAMNLPYSSEILAGAPAGAAGADTHVTYQGINMGGYDPALIENIDLAAYPVVGSSTARARDIFLQGRAMGNNPNVLAKVGDCSSEHWFFLSVFAWGKYDLGEYGYLQPVIDHFGESLGYNSEATHNGFNVNAVMHPDWSDPSVCQKGESPLQCEFRLHKPSVVIIMFGTSDLLVMTPYEFDFYLRDIVDQSIEAGVIPVLSTFPGNKGFWDRTVLYNQIVVRIALDYDIPLINLWLALEDLPNKGLEPDGFHLGEPEGEAAGYLTGNYLKVGYNVRNLVTLQTLDNIWRNAMR